MKFIETLNTKVDDSFVGKFFQIKVRYRGCMIKSMIYPSLIYLSCLSLLHRHPSLSYIGARIDILNRGMYRNSRNLFSILLHSLTSNILNNYHLYSLLAHLLLFLQWVSNITNRIYRQLINPYVSFTFCSQIACPFLLYFSIYSCSQSTYPC